MSYQEHWKLPVFKLFIMTGVKLLVGDVAELIKKRWKKSASWDFFSLEKRN